MEHNDFRWDAEKWKRTWKSPTPRLNETWTSRNKKTYSFKWNEKPETRRMVRLKILGNGCYCSSVLDTYVTVTKYTREKQLKRRLILAHKLEAIVHLGCRSRGIWGYTLSVVKKQRLMKPNDGPAFSF